MYFGNSSKTNYYSLHSFFLIATYYCLWIYQHHSTILLWIVLFSLEIFFLGDSLLRMRLLTQKVYQLLISWNVARLISKKCQHLIFPLYYFLTFSPTIYILSLLSFAIPMGIKRYLIPLVHISLLVTELFICFWPPRLLVCELFLIFNWFAFLSI